MKEQSILKTSLRGLKMPKSKTQPQNVQTLTEADLDKISLIIKSSLEPIQSKLQNTDLEIKSINQELRGKDGNNGIIATLKTMLPRREAYVALTIASTIIGIITSISSCVGSYRAVLDMTHLPTQQQHQYYNDK